MFIKHDHPRALPQPHVNLHMRSGAGVGAAAEYQHSRCYGCGMLNPNPCKTAKDGSLPLSPPLPPDDLNRGGAPPAPPVVGSAPVHIVGGWGGREGEESRLLQFCPPAPVEDLNGGQNCMI